MQKVSNWHKQITCPNCGTILEITKKDIETKVAPVSQRWYGRTFLCRRDITFSISCLSCKHKLNLEVEELPTLVLSWIETRFGINYTPTDLLPDSCDLQRHRPLFYFFSSKQYLNIFSTTFLQVLTSRYPRDQLTIHQRQCIVVLP